MWVPPYKRKQGAHNARRISLQDELCMIPCSIFERQTEISEIIMCLSSHLGLVEVESCEFKSEYSTKKCPILVWPPNMGSWHEVDKVCRTVVYVVACFQLWSLTHCLKVYINRLCGKCQLVHENVPVNVPTNRCRSTTSIRLGEKSERVKVRHFSGHFWGLVFSSKYLIQNQNTN